MHGGIFQFLQSSQEKALFLSIYAGVLWVLTGINSLFLTKIDLLSKEMMVCLG